MIYRGFNRTQSVALQGVTPNRPYVFTYVFIYVFIVLYSQREYQKPRQ